MVKLLRRSTIAPLVVVAAMSVSAQVTPNDRALGVDVTGMDRSVRPQDDFFRFVNGAWIDRTPIPPDMSQYGTFAVLRDEAAAAVRRILETAAAERAAPGSIAQKVGGFYRSAIDSARVESLGLQPLARELAAIGAISKTGDFPAAFARAAGTGVRLPISVAVGQDPKQSEVYTVLVSQSGTPLLSPSSP